MVIKVVVGSEEPNDRDDLHESTREATLVECSTPWIVESILTFAILSEKNDTKAKTAP